MKADTPLQQRVRAAIAASGASRDALDRRLQQALGTSGKPLWDIERGKSRSPSVKTRRAIAQLFGMHEDAFMTIEHDVPPMQMVRGSTVGSSITLRQVDLGYSMGPGANIDDYVEEGLLDFDAALLRTITRSPPEKLYVARGDGDSMFPTLINNDMVLIDTLQRQLNLQDRVWAVSIHGAGAIKRLRAIGNQRVLITSDNPTVGTQEVDAADLAIMGRVIWVGRRM